MAIKPQRSVRVSEILWNKVKAKAASEGKTASEVINDFLKEYAK